MDSCPRSLTPYERLTLRNQFAILRVVEKTTAYDEAIEVLEAGNAFRYRVVFGVLSEELLDTVSRFVTRVLWMHRDLHHADPTIVFEGFDGNNECDHLAAARLAIGVARAWDEQKPFEAQTDGWNAHSPRVEAYTKQLEVWEVLPHLSLIHI